MHISSTLRPIALGVLLLTFCSCGDDEPTPTTAQTNTATTSTTSNTTRTNTGTSPNVCTPPSRLFPTSESPFLIGAAGAPLVTFGPEDTPTFETGFDTLNTIGFNAFFPWFGIQEVDGVASVSRHFDFWLPSEFVGLQRNCTVNNPYTAAKERIKILFPAFFFSDAEGSNPFNRDEFQRRFELFRDTCWGGDDSGIAAFQSFDELATRYIISTYFGEAAPRLRNAPDAANQLKTLSDVPVLLIEGPLPFVVEQEAGLSEEQKRTLIADFWDAVDATTPRADLFGFNIYPVETAPLTISAEYVLEARTRAPETEGIAVIQGFSYNAETGRRDPRRGPNTTENRFMAMDAILAGAPNLIWYGASALDLERPEDVSVWEGVQASVALTRRVGPMIPLPEVRVTTSEGIGVIARDLGEDAIGLVILNRTGQTTRATLTLPRDVQTIEDVETEETHPHDGSRTLTLDLAPWEVRVFAASSCGT